MKIQKVKGEPKRVTQTTVKPEYRHLEDWQLNPDYHFEQRETFDVRHLRIFADENLISRSTYTTEKGVDLRSSFNGGCVLTPLHPILPTKDLLPKKGQKITP